MGISLIARVACPNAVGTGVIGPSANPANVGQPARKLGQN